MSETILSTRHTRSGHPVEVLQVTTDRTTDLDEAAQASGPIWRCGGCKDGSDKPLNSVVFNDPLGIVTAAATSHATSCRA